MLRDAIKSGMRDSIYRIFISNILIYSQHYMHSVMNLLHHPIILFPVHCSSSIRVEGKC